MEGTAKKWYAEVDKQRRIIDRARKKSVQEQINVINQAVWKHFKCTEYEIELRMDSEELVLLVDGAVILFPAGILRKKKFWKTPDYTISIITSIRG